MHAIVTQFKRYVPWINAGAAILLGAIWLINLQTPLPQIIYQVAGAVFIVSGGLALVYRK